MTTYLLAIDQGTTNSRAIIFNQIGQIISQHEIGLRQSYPFPGWVEQQPEEWFDHSIECCRMALKKANLTAKEIAAVGIANQRETTIIWDKTTGRPIYPAIVWQDRRTSELCRKLTRGDKEKVVQQKTGLLIDSYFSATKIMWILNHIDGARERAEAGELLFGTVDTYLLWRLTLGKVHATDVTNASRTLLYNIHTNDWDQALLKKFKIPAQLLPVIRDNTADYGQVDASLLGASISITGIAGDQQAAMIGQACFKPGMIKSTYGTGLFMLLNTGKQIVQSHNKLLTTILYRINHEVAYGLEGSIFSAGVTVKWLRDKLKLINTAAESEPLAKSVANTEGVYLVPAFCGLGAPYWDADARAAIVGMTQDTGVDHIVRAGLESVAYQTLDLLDAMLADYGKPTSLMHVDGGMSANDWLLQCVADILRVEVQRPVVTETTALGAAYLAGLQVGVYTSLEDIAQHWRMDASFEPMMSASQRNQLYQGWKRAVKRVLGK